MQKKSNEFVAIGLMLFALFFGAGNLIFPVFMGQNAGINVTWATLGFLITGVGLPFAGVLAVCYSGDDLQNLASRVAPWYGVVFTVLLYLTIGPFFAIPRTATVSYEIAVAPLLGPEAKSIGLYAFAFVFFALSWWLAITPGKMVSRIGKVITPLLLIFLVILIGASFMNPMGIPQAPTDNYATPVGAAVQGFLDGYNTMDALAALVFGVIVVQSVKMFGKTTHEEITYSCLRAGLISTIIMALIYGSLSFLGASSVQAIGIQENGAPVLVLRILRHCTLWSEHHHFRIHSGSDVPLSTDYRADPAGTDRQASRRSTQYLCMDYRSDRYSISLCRFPYRRHCPGRCRCLHGFPAICTL